ncbi:MAG TPA: hypothetical protein VIK20_07270 [Bacteroidales bacterium]
MITYIPVYHMADEEPLSTNELIEVICETIYFIHPVILYVQSARKDGRLSKPSFTFKLFNEYRILSRGSNLDE